MIQRQRAVRSRGISSHLYTSISGKDALRISFANYLSSCSRRTFSSQTPRLKGRHEPPQTLQIRRNAFEFRSSRPDLETPASTRSFATSSPLRHGDLTPPAPGQEREVTFIDKEGQHHTFQVADGNNLLDIAQANDLEMEGACGGSCACSTCHVIVQDEAMYDKMEEPSDDENDMLDLAFGLTETSRLGCQVEMSKELGGLVVKLPSMTRNMQASDFADKK